MGSFPLASSSWWASKHLFLFVGSFHIAFLCRSMYSSGAASILYRVFLGAPVVALHLGVGPFYNCSVVCSVRGMCLVYILCNICHCQLYNYFGFGATYIEVLFNTRYLFS